MTNANIESYHKSDSEVKLPEFEERSIKKTLRNLETILNMGAFA